MNCTVNDESVKAYLLAYIMHGITVNIMAYVSRLLWWVHSLVNCWS